MNNNQLNPLPVHRKSAKFEKESDAMVMQALKDALFGLTLLVRSIEDNNLSYIVQRELDVAKNILQSKNINI